MDKIYEVIDSITKRLANPFLVSFVISWLGTNWRAVLVAISNDHYIKKIEYLEKTLYKSDAHPKMILCFIPATAAEMSLFWIPLAWACGYVFISPLTSTIATAVSGLYDNLNEWVRAFVLKLRVLTLKQSQELQVEMETKFTKLNDDNLRLQTARIESTKKAGELAMATLNRSQWLILPALHLIFKTGGTTSLKCLQSSP